MIDTPIIPSIPEEPAPAGDGTSGFVTLVFDASPEPAMFFRVGAELDP